MVVDVLPPRLRGVGLRLWTAADLDLGPTAPPMDPVSWRRQGVEWLSGLADRADAVIGHGRRAARRLWIGDRAGVWRTNRHGGLLSGMLGGRFASARRLAEEVELSAALRRAGIATPEVLLAVAVRQGLWWRQHLVTAEVAGACTVFEARHDPRALAAADLLLERLCEVGLWAPDLHPANMLWQAVCGRCWVIDLAGAELRPRPLRDDERRARRARFARYFRKHAGEVPAPFAL